MKYIKVNLTFDKDNDYITDLLSNDLATIGFDSFIDSEDGLEAYIEASKYNEDRLKTLLFEFVYDEGILFSAEKMEDKNWNEEWEKNFFDPIIISDKCVIHSSFHKDFPKCEYDIIINPKMAFGTGHHETTSLMIEEILKMDFRGKKVLDMGCGTSVLAILAEKCGASELTAIDIDDWCVNNSLENIEINKNKNIKVLLGGAELLVNMNFDIVLANINRNILLADMEKYISVLNPKGLLFMSGFYIQDIPMIEQKANELGLKLIHSHSKNNWALVKFEKG